MLGDLQRLVMQQRDFLLKVLEACVTLKTHVETDLQNGWGGHHVPEVAEARELLAKARTSLNACDGPADAHHLYSSLSLEKQRLQAKYQEMLLQCQLDDLIGNSVVVFDFPLLKQALSNLHTGGDLTGLSTAGGRMAGVSQPHNPILFLANYCMSQLYSRHMLTKQQQQQQQNGTIEWNSHGALAPPAHVIVAPQAPPAAVVRAPGSAYPLYYFNVDVNGSPHGRIVIEVRPDVAPKMAKNFSVLCTGEMGVSYKGCAVFQCW